MISKTNKHILASLIFQTANGVINGFVIYFVGLGFLYDL